MSKRQSGGRPRSAEASNRRDAVRDAERYAAAWQMSDQGDGSGDESVMRLKNLYAEIIDMDDKQPHDPSEEIPKADDLSVKRERKEEAEGLMESNSVFMLGVKATRMRWFQELMVAKDRETKDNLTYKLQVLDEVANSLQGFVTDYKMALKAKR